MNASAKDRQERYSAEETQRRFEAALRSALNTPPKPHSEMKIGKRAPRKTKPAKVKQENK